MSDPIRPGLSRRRFLSLAGGGVVIAGAGAAGVALWSSGRAEPVLPTDPRVLAAERSAARSGTGSTVRAALTATPSTVDLGGVLVDTWTYDGTVPGPMIRATTGDRLIVSLTNQLPAPTTVHWHGLALRNDMDGVPGLTQAPVAPSATHEYDFLLRHPGTYWFHPHVGTQLDRGLYAPLIVDDPADPADPGDHDAEAVLVLDDWLDGVDGRDPDQELARLRREGMGMAGMAMGGSTVSEQDPLGMDTGDVVYPYYLINGRIPTAPHTITATAGQRLRLRLINAGSDTAFRFAVGGHALQVVASDGYPVTPVTVDSLVIGMGERYDVVITARDGRFPIVAQAEGKQGRALAVLATAAGPAPSVDTEVRELTGRLLSYTDLSPTTTVALPNRPVTRTIPVELGMSDPFVWTMNGRTYRDASPLTVSTDERVRLVFVNRTSMFHPMHVHGHTFALVDGGARKDTVNVLPGQSLAVDLQTDNPGQWLVHCHNLYHGEAGMMTTLSYREG